MDDWMWEDICALEPKRASCGEGGYVSMTSRFTCIYLTEFVCVPVAQGTWVDVRKGGGMCRYDSQGMRMGVRKWYMYSCD